MTLLQSASLVFLTLLVTLLYRLTLHPLARIPGPRLAALSSSWLAWHARNGRLASLARLHAIYGPVVRVAPGEVWFNSEGAFRAIYSPGGCEKSDFYIATLLSKPDLDWLLRPRLQDTLDLLSERDTKRYALQRRRLGPVYRASAVLKYEGAVDEVLHRAVAWIKALDGEEVDLKEWMHILAVECLGAVVLSWSPGLLAAGSDRGSGEMSYLAWRTKTVFGYFPLMARVNWAERGRWIGRLFAQAWGLRYRHGPNFRPFFPDVQKRVSKRIAAALRPDPPKDDRKDLMADLIQLHRDKPDFNTTYLRRMGITNFGAGHETMAATLTAVVAMIASQQRTQDHVAEEARTVDASSMAVASGLRYTQACIDEAKRLHPVIGTAPPRVVPAGGLVIDGVWLPGGTSVGCHPGGLHRNPDICVGGDPGGFEPERWLGDKDGVRRMKNASLAWGGASRTCPGRHLAELVVFKAVPVLFGAFEMEVDVPGEEEQRAYFMSMLSGVKVRFRER